MACAVKVKKRTNVCSERVLNTIDKGYSVIITLPNKMSLVCPSFCHLMGPYINMIF